LPQKFQVLFIENVFQYRHCWWRLYAYIKIETVIKSRGDWIQGILLPFSLESLTLRSSVLRPKRSNPQNFYLFCGNGKRTRLKMYKKDMLRVIFGKKKMKKKKKRYQLERWKKLHIQKLEKLYISFT
jgi:hypothetical protein